jgi:hypothetical protein
MEELVVVPLQNFDITPTVNDLFWKEKNKRLIEECGSVTQLREIACLLLDIATQRQGVIKGLMKEIMLQGIKIDEREVLNPSLEKGGA